MLIDFVDEGSTCWAKDVTVGTGVSVKEHLREGSGEVSVHRLGWVERSGSEVCEGLKGTPGPERRKHERIVKETNRDFCRTGHFQIIVGVE